MTKTMTMAICLGAVAVTAAGERIEDNPSVGAWLAPMNGAGLTPALRTEKQAAIGKVDALLSPLGGQLRLLACWYDGSKLVAARPFVADNLRTSDTRWTSEVRAAPVPGEPDALELIVTIKLAEGETKSAGIAVAFVFADWSEKNYVLIPASVYNGNRNRIEFRGYCTGFSEEDFYNKNMPVTHGDVPRLELESAKPSKIEVNASNATTPAICFFSPGTKHAFILLAEQGIREGDQILDNGLMVEENNDRSRASLVVSVPGVRERKPEFIGFSASPDRGIDWKAGKEVTLRLRVYSFASPDIAGLLKKFMTVRKAITGPNHPRNLIPFSEVARLMTGRIDRRWHKNAAGQYYCPENSDNLCLGWIGGLMNTFPMLALGDEMHRQRATKTFDFAIPAAQGKSGYFLATVHPDGKASGRDWYPKRPIVLTRQNADVLFWMTKQLMLLKAQGRADAIKPEWERAVKRLAQAFVNTWRRHGQWGNYLNHETGEVAIYNSTSGAMAIGGLALASIYFNEPQFLDVAEKAADYYYSNDFVQKGFTCGACSDITQNADSETAAGFMTALMALHETTGEKRWLEMSRNLANLVATWTVSYDYELPKNTELGGLGAKLAGVYWASTQNKHGAPGICTSSGDALFKLYRASGDRRYAELLRDIVHAHAEGIKPTGEITERLSYCDADSRGSRGGGSTGWTETNGILMATELPGIYVRTDKDEMFVFDHVEARVVKREDDRATLSIANPTKFDAKVAIFAESEEQAEKPLGVTAFLKWPKVEIKAGATVQIAVYKGIDYHEHRHGSPRPGTDVDVRASAQPKNIRIGDMTILNPTESKQAAGDPAAVFEAARWIAPPVQADGEALPIFRKEFILAASPASATLRVVGLGDYDLLVNGNRVAETGINQPWSQYEKTIYYRDFDVTGLLEPGPNCIGVMLANSFLNNQNPPPGRYNKDGPQRAADEPFRLRAELILRASDGAIQRIGSDATWRTTAGPVTFSHIFAGEDYDARRRLPGWDRAGFDDSTWSATRELTPPPAVLERQFWPGFQEYERFAPATVKEPAPGVFLYAFDQNCSAQLRVELDGGKPGDRISFRCGEHKNAQDRLFGGYVVGCDVMTDGRPLRRQWMSYYLGMQYVEIAGAVPEGSANPNQLPVIKKLELVHVRTALPEVGKFKCSSDLLNRTHDLIDWAIRSNMSHVMTDCPHREKLGWLECAYLLEPSFLYRYDGREWFAKIARDIRDAQEPSGRVLTVAPSYAANRFGGGFNFTVEWGAAAVLVPWQHYLWYGNPQILRDNFEMMRKYTDYLSTAATDGIAPAGGLGDWYDYGHGKEPGESQFTPTDLSATATWALCSLAVSRAAEALGRPAEAANYRELHARIAADFQRRFLDPNTRKLRHTGSPQCANAMALYADVAPADARAALVEEIIADLQNRHWQQTPGDVGHVYFIRALAGAGRSDVLHRVYSRDGKGSYGGILSKGLTSLPETWDATMDGIQSLNHCMLGHVMEWLYGYVAGIRQPSGSAGWQRVLIGPNPGALTAAQATLQTPRGRVASRWRADGATFHLESEIPQGVEAEALMPSGTRRRLSSGLNILDEPMAAGRDNT